MLGGEKIPASRAFLGRGASRCPFPYRSRCRVSPASDSASDPCAFSRRSHVAANLFRLSNRRGPEKACDSSRFLTRIAFERKSKQARPCSETKRREGLPLGDDSGREGATGNGQIDLSNEKDDSGREGATGNGQIDLSNEKDDSGRG